MEKDNKFKEAVFQYKCRMCGKVYDGVCCGDNIVFPIFIAVLLDAYDLVKPYVGVKPKMVEFHLCDKKTDRHGVGDLIGYIVRDTG